MTSSPEDNTLSEFEAALAALENSSYELTLFVIGASDLSAQAISNVRQLCDRYLPDRYRLSVVDLVDDPEAAKRSGVLATPTLVKHRPLPVRRLVGDLSQVDRVLSVLEIHRASPAKA